MGLFQIKHIIRIVVHVKDMQPYKCDIIQQMAVFPSYFFFFYYLFVKDENLKWVEDNIPSSLTDV